MLTPREKSPLPKKFSPEEDRTQEATSGRTASPTHYQQAVPVPCHASDTVASMLPLTDQVSVYCDRVRTGIASLICRFYLSVAKCLCKSFSEIHSKVAGRLSNQKTNNS